MPCNNKLELVYLPKSKYCVYHRMVYGLQAGHCDAPPPPPPPHFGWPKITFYRISRHFRSIRNFYLFSQNGFRRPFWMTENHFWSHFSPFEINTQFLFIYLFPQNAAILDDRKSLSIAFLAISDHYATLIFFFHKMAHGGHFGWPKITFDRISRLFRSIRNFRFLIVAAGGYFGGPKITFDRISHHFRSLPNFDFFRFFFTKWLPAAIWMTEKSLSIEFLAILDQYTTFFVLNIFQNGCWWPFWRSDLRQTQ